MTNNQLRSMLHCLPIPGDSLASGDLEQIVGDFRLNDTGPSAVPAYPDATTRTQLGPALPTSTHGEA
jgi:hypothetical protein